VTIPPQFRCAESEQTREDSARYDAEHDRARIGVGLADVSVALQKPQQLATIQQPPARLQAGEKVELPLRQCAFPNPIK
jgi:hypothetical protein